MRQRIWDAVLFDMDGTTLDTLGDLRHAMNYALGKTGHRQDFDLEEVAAFVGSGINVAMARALCREQGYPLKALEKIGTDGDPVMEQHRAEAEKIAAIFRPYYTANSEHLTRPYAGIPALLRGLRAQGMQTAIVSNKPDAAVQVLEKRFFEGLLDAAMGERQPMIRRKPAPDMVLQVLLQLGVKKERAVYIGDSEVDLETARNVGMDCIAVSWGFRSRSFLASHGASVIADSTEELAALLGTTLL